MRNVLAWGGTLNLLHVTFGSNDALGTPGADPWVGVAAGAVLLLAAALWPRRGAVCPRKPDKPPAVVPGPPPTWRAKT